MRDSLTNYLSSTRGGPSTTRIRVHKQLHAFTGIATLLCLFGVLKCNGEQLHFAAPNGTPAGKGTIDSPWDLRTAFNHPQAVRPGDILYLRGGVYEVPGKLNFNCRLRGEVDAPITIRPWRSEKATIDGGIHVLGGWVVLRDLEVRNTTPQRQTEIAGSFPADITQPTGINVFAANVRVINNVVRDSANGLSSWREAPDNEFYGNIVFNNGWSGPDRPHGHGVYMQNRDGRKVLEDNIVFNNFEYGVQIYGSSETYLNNFHLEGNVIFGNGAPGGAFSRNILLGGTTLAQSPVLINNFTYYPLTANHGGDNNLGYYPSGSGCTGLVMQGNYFASGGLALTMHKCEVARMEGNTFLGSIRAFEKEPFATNNQFSTDRPGANRVTVRPNRYERGRAHIVVFNWERRENVQVDLSSAGLAEGDIFEIRDVQNLTGTPVVTGRYTGESVDLPMTSSTVLKPHGNTRHDISHTDSEFGVFLLRRVSGATERPAAAVTIEVEAEDASHGETVAVETAEDASGSAALRFPSDGGWVAFSADIPATGIYRLWVRVRQNHGEASSFLLSGGESPADLCTVPGDGTAQWHWIGANQRGGDGVIDRYFQLQQGPAMIAFAAADGSLLFDRFILTSDLTFHPDQSL